MTSALSCRVCGGENLVRLFDLGNQYVSDFVDRDQITSGDRVPIVIEQCQDCTLVQAKHSPPPASLYEYHYWYRSGITQTMRDALRDIAEEGQKRVGGLKEGDIVLDIGANDGTLLSNYDPFKTGVVRIACEPARNLHAECRLHCEELIEGMWDERSFAEAVRHLDIEVNRTDNQAKAKIVTAIGMFYDLDDPNQFIADVAKVLHPDGIFIAQLMCLKQTIENRDVGNFAHEHLEFYTLKSLMTLFERHGLTIVDIKENSVNGGSYRLYVKHRLIHGVWRVPPQSAVEIYRNDAVTSKSLASFSQEIDANRRKCVEFIQNEVDRGKRVWIYGASTKGNVIAQYYGLDKKHIEAAADRDPNKWGKFLVGSGIPITSEEQFRAAQPDYALVMPYAFRGEFIEREREYLSCGGKFIFPLPEFEVVG